MSDIKMSDVLSLPLALDLVTDCCDGIEQIARDSVGDFAFGMPDDISIEHVVQAVNSYDSNQEEIARLTKALEDEKAKTRWISVDDDLPEFHVDILFSTKHDVVIGRYYRSSNKFISSNGDKFYASDVTGWMYRPEATKSEE